MKIFPILLTMLLGLSSLFAQTENWQKQRERERARWEQQRQREKKAWEQQRREERARWQDMVDRESAAWQAHVAAVKRKWQEVRFSDVKNWVGYGENKDSRFQADFENGNLTIEVLGDPGSDPALLQQQALSILNQLLRERAADNQPPILDNQLQYGQDGRQIPPDHIRRQNYTAPDGRQYQQMTVNIPFRQNHLRNRAQAVWPAVQRFAQKYEVDPKLIMAIIHTESAFNPKAISTFRRAGGRVGHAYGLMQLVPYSGGKEAYEFLGGRGEPSPAILFDPEKNIELGIAYLHKLKHYHFAGVLDLQNRRCLITAGYNTGPNNVARAFGGRRQVNAVIPQINAMPPDRLYAHLLYNLPYYETRDYLRKVQERVGLY